MPADVAETGQNEIINLIVHGLRSEELSHG
jgi:hypothetical protein